MPVPVPVPVPVSAPVTVPIVPIVPVAVAVPPPMRQSRIEAETLQALELNTELERIRKVTAEQTEVLESTLGASLGSGGLKSPGKIPLSEVQIQVILPAMMPCCGLVQHSPSRDVQSK